MASSFLKNLEWRFATKKFDSEKKVSREDLEKILKAIRLAPTSRGLQPFHVIVVQDKKLKEALYPVSKEQEQVVDCQYLLVFCYRLDLHQRVAQYFPLFEELNPPTPEQHAKRVKKYEDFTARKEAKGLKSWVQRQTYIALGFGLAACAELQIDSCPMEGLQNEKVDQLLGLPSYMKTTAYLAIGYRGAEPTKKKFRFPEEDLFSFR